ncbi:FAD-dependent oxidoreductase [Paractinoplanes toevensis]|nr:FAD-dependent oxidoreductase [Actinoplanes toevensis]
MAADRNDVLIIGAGVIGLTTGVQLVESSGGSAPRVHIVAEQWAEETNSAAAGAIFDPSHAQHDRLGDWAGRTARRFGQLAGEHFPGVTLVDGLEACRQQLRPPPYIESLPTFRPCPPAELPQGFVTGWRYRVPVIDMPPYLKALRQRFEAGGGTLSRGRLGSLAEVTAEAGIVVNCTGIGARDLVPDTQVHPSRGRLVVVGNPQGRKTFFAEYTTGEQHDMTYVFPHGATLVLGGSMEKGEDAAMPDDEIPDAILRRCREAFPGETFDDHARRRRTGIRPHRPEVRLEVEPAGDGHIIHNYGHGGSGVTLSWGCAEQVADIVFQLRS